eukprot:7556649-Pyramimonas_sp.AAC.1
MSQVWSSRVMWGQKQSARDQTTCVSSTMKMQYFVSIGPNCAPSPNKASPIVLGRSSASYTSAHCGPRLRGWCRSPPQ